jgi:gliding motility-associated-like protein
LFPNLAAGDFYVQVRDINGCTDTAQINVKAALPFFITSATADTTIQFLDSLQLMVGLNDTTNNTVSSNWILLGANGDTLASNKYKLWIAPQDAGQYLFRATNQNGCIVDTTINIGVLKNRFANAPTGFTPNGDGTNDKFFVQAANDTKIEKVLTFRVYDRWGELVHEATDIMPNDDSKGWDGTFKGKEMNAGVFAWYAEIKYKDGFIQTIKGDVTLLK